MRKPEDQIRPALRKLAERFAETRLVVVVAPAGSGKTTLLACWQAELAAAGADWVGLQISPVHDDPALFLEDWFEALPQGIGPAPLAQLLREIPHVDREDTHAVARRAARALRNLGRPLHLFLDDTHRLTRDGPTDRLLDLLVREGPPLLRFVIASRGARPRAAARLIASNVALELSGEDLSLRSDQVATVLRDRGVEPSAVTPPLLAETRGWATGVQLAARAIARIEESDRAAFIQTLARQPDLFDYVAGELMSDEPAETLRVLELAAVLGPTDEPTLLRVSPAAVSLAAVDRALDRGLLLREGERLGVHPLWEEFLLRRLRDRLSPQDWRALHEEIARRLARTDPKRALRLYGSGGVWEGVAQLLEQHGRPWLDRGHYHFVEEWLVRLADAGVEPSPTHAHLAALTSARRDPVGAIARLEATAAEQRGAGDRAGEAIALVDAWIIAANENRPEAMPAILRRLLSMRRLVTDADSRALSMVAVSIMLVSRDRHRVAARLLRGIRREGLGSVPRATIVMGLQIIGRYTDWDETLRLLDGVCADPAHRAHAPSFFLFQANRALIRSSRGFDPEACLAEAEEAAEAFRDFRLTLSEMVSLDIVAKLLVRLGRREEAVSRFEQAAGLAERLGNAEFEATLFAHSARELLALGRREDALQRARCAVEVFEQRAPSRDPVHSRFTAMHAFRMLAECGDAADAYRRALRQEKQFRSPELPIALHQTSLLMARTAHLAGEEDEARKHLVRARKVAERHGPRDLGAELDPQILAWADDASRDPVASWDVRTLGGLEVARDGQTIPWSAWRGVTTRRVLVRLLSAPHGERRELLEADLWPTADPRRARNNLRVALSRLRKALGEDAVVAEGDRVGLVDALRAGWDVTRLEAALGEPGDAELATALLRGPFAPELYDDWAEEQRREIEAKILAQGNGRAEALLDAADPESAAALARSLVAFAPLGEEAWALCARAELAGGDARAARSTLTRARALLDRELGTEPTAELLAVEAALRAKP